jgi:hypothetical protein
LHLSPVRSFLLCGTLLSSLALAQGEVSPSTPPPPPPVSAAAPNLELAPEPERNAVFTAQIIPWAFGVYGVGYEHAVSETFSITVGANLTLTTVVAANAAPNSSRQTVTIAGGGVQPGVAFYLAGPAPAGLWVSPKLELSYLSITQGFNSGGGSPSSEFSTTVGGLLYGGHVMIGYTHIFSNGFTLSGGLGIGGGSSSFSTSTSGGGVSSSPFILTASLGRFAFGAGWAF